MSALVGNQVLEYVEETTEGQTPANPAMQWIALLNPVSLKLPQKYTTTRYLADEASTNKLGAIVNVQHSEEIELSFTAEIQSLDFWAKYCLGSATGTADNLPSLSFGIIVDVNGTKYYALVKGAKCKDAKLSVEEDGTFKLEATFRGIDFSGFSTTDYIGTGSHASVNTANPLKWKDMSALTWGGNDFNSYGCYIRALEINTSYDLKEIKDVGAATSTGIVTIVPVKREIKVSLTADFSSLDMVNQIRNGNKADLAATIGTKTVTVKDVIFPEVGMELKPDDLVEQDFESLECTGITIA